MEDLGGKPTIFGNIHLPIRNISGHHQPTDSDLVSLFWPVDFGNQKVMSSRLFEIIQVFFSIRATVQLWWPWNAVVFFFGRTRLTSFLLEGPSRQQNLKMGGLHIWENNDPLLEAKTNIAEKKRTSHVYLFLRRALRNFACDAKFNPSILNNKSTTTTLKKHEYMNILTCLLVFLGFRGLLPNSDRNSQTLHPKRDNGPACSAKMQLDWPPGSLTV